MGFDSHTPAGDHLVDLATHLSGPQSATLSALLRSQGIEVMSSHDWVTGSYLGNVTLRVAAADEEPARQVLRVQEAKHASIRKFHPHEEVCLACGAAMGEDAESCAICGWSFVEGDEEEVAETGSRNVTEEKTMDETLVTVATCWFVAEADSMQALLANEGIDVYVIDANTVALLGQAIGNIKLQTPTSQVARAQEILARHAAEREAERERGDVGTTCLSCGAPMGEDDEQCAACGWSYASGEDGGTETEV